MSEPSPEHPPDQLDAHATWTRALCPTCGRLPRPSRGRHLAADSRTKDGKVSRVVNFWCELGHLWTTSWTERP